MAKLFRTLLIVCAVAAPVLAGVSETIVASPSVAWTQASPSPFDDHHEDDAGTTAEQAEEDDTEEEVFRHLPLLCASAWAHAADHLRHMAGMPSCPKAAAAWRCGHSSRGPPA